MNTPREMALAGIKEGRQSRYKTTCLLIILMLFSVSCQSDNLEFYGLLDFLFTVVLSFHFSSCLNLS